MLGFASTRSPKRDELTKSRAKGGFETESSSGFVWPVLRWRVFVYRGNSITATRLPKVWQVSVERWMGGS